MAEFSVASDARKLATIIISQAPILIATLKRRHGVTTIAALATASNSVRSLPWSSKTSPASISAAIGRRAALVTAQDDLHRLHKLFHCGWRSRIKPTFDRKPLGYFRRRHWRGRTPQDIKDRPTTFAMTKLSRGLLLSNSANLPHMDCRIENADGPVDAGEVIA